ncbi:Starch-binding associating with outer membrane [Chryseobacterium taeanense]|uniref:Starch-binding associating with outer membrane n=1 Tax=Chryseobacterium taeanense TaxID=311334 RepID=A0A1G8DLU9_9FLAO|nr:SusD/RagB family nutrient-binding outer membrane lipoprotein [Chryseobacterium taeanense]SDH58673.1 Starch-binding associating with outer membrane [Chryseobacterium taeanense]
MKKIKYIISSLIVMVSLTSCDKYLDVNENPNSIHSENITPELLFPGAVAQSYRVQAGDMMQFGNLMMNSWAGDVYSYGGLYPNEFSLSAVNSQFYDGIWDNIYQNVNNFVAIENYPNGNHRQDSYIAMAKIMKAFYMQYIVDLYGDAPYTQAFKGQNNLAPKYDNDADIYKSLITNLDEAVALIKTNLDTPNPDVLDPGAKDIVFGGDMTKWRSFAYTVKLRYLLRMSNVTGELATYRDAQLAALSTASGSGAGFISGDVLENPGYGPSTNDKMSPVFLNYFYNSAGNEVQNHIVITASEHLAIALNGNLSANPTQEYQKFNGVIDPRRFRLFTGVVYNGVGQVKGVRQGATAGQPGAPTDNQNVSKLANGNVVGGATSGSLLTIGGSRSGVIMSLAEAKFLLAEASLRYPTLFTGGQSAFNSAILASGNWIGANSIQMNNYISQISTRPGLGWTGTDAQKLEAIMTQKWIALTNVNPTEMYIEYNRTNLPYNPVAVSAVKTRRPYRLVYPNSEYATNSANVPNISSDVVFTKNQYTPFWNQN